MRRALILSFCGALTAAGLEAAVEGRVLTSDGRPVEHARVEVVEGAGTTFSDMRGSFRLVETDPPVLLLVTHPRFEARSEEIAAETPQPVEILLQPKQEFYEEIAVSANRGEENFSPVSVASSVVEPAAAVSPPGTLAELISDVPGVSENGQGGLFQNYSIRGVSRLRVLTLVSGMRIVGERRAGVSASFIDPLLLGSVDVLRGPSSTYYGSGALGGVVQLFPRRFEDLSLEVGYGTQGSENYQVLGWGRNDWSIGLARRRAGRSDTPGGDELYSGFEQLSGLVGKSWGAGRRRFSLEAVGSLGRDIEKANTDYPDRITTYPREEHLLLRFAAVAESGWRLEAWVHPNTLETVVERPGRDRDEVENEAFDLGFNLQQHRQMTPATVARYGLDWFGRRGVEAVETARELSPAGAPSASTRQVTLDGAQEDEVGFYGALEWNWGRTVILAGGRAAWQRQENGGMGSSRDSALTGFAGLVAPLGAGFEVAANVGSGLRFPSLSERFFSGTTGRGEVVGNPDLAPERSLSLDAGLRWYGNRLFVSVYLFRNDIDDYIERVEVEPGLLTFVNLSSGAIDGAELEGLYRLSESWSLDFGGHLLEGRSDAQEALADVPADRFFLAGRWSRDRWGWEGRWEQRAEKNDPGSGEKPIPAASLVSMSLSYRWTDSLSLRLSGRNLLGEEYFNSADDKVPLSPGRSVALGLRWSAAGADGL